MSEAAVLSVPLESSANAGPGVRTTLLRTLALTAVGLCAAAPMDLPAARFVRTRIPWSVSQPLENVEPFGHAFGITLIAVTVAVLDPQRKTVVRGIAAATVGAGAFATALKHLVVRIRPRNVDVLEGGLWSTFRGWDHYVFADSARQSFPSGHAAAATALAVVLGAAYPKGRVWFFFLAALVCLQRVLTWAHYPTDVIAGAAIGSVVAQLTLRIPGLNCRTGAPR